MSDADSNEILDLVGLKMYYFKTDGLFEFKGTISPCAILVCNDFFCPVCVFQHNTYSISAKI